MRIFNSFYWATNLISKASQQQFWQHLWKKKMFTGKESLVTPCSALVHNYGCGASSPTTIALTSPFQKFSQQYEPTFFLFTSSLSEFLVESSMYGPKNSRRSVTSFTFHSSSESNGRAFCVCVCASSLLTPCKTSGDSVLEHHRPWLLWTTVLLPK